MNITCYLKKQYKKEKKGELSLPLTIVILIMVILIAIMLTEYSNIRIIRTLEAASDLAAEQALRSYVDEDELRQERLELIGVNSSQTDRNETFGKIRDLYLEKMRECVPTGNLAVERIEIPTITASKIEIPEDYMAASFPNSTSKNFSLPSETIEGRTEYYLGGTNSDNAAITICKDTTGLATSGSKAKTSYFFNVHTTIIYKTLSIFDRGSYNLLNYVNILTGNTVSIKTKKIKRGVTAVTIQSTGKVTLR